LAQVSDEQYLEYFNCQLQNVEELKKNGVWVFPVYSNYFSLYDSSASNVGYLNYDLGESVCKWYCNAKGFVDTIRGCQHGFYKEMDQVLLLRNLIETLEELIVDGDKLLKELGDFFEILTKEKSYLQLTLEAY
jgi:hypothetical protein